MVESINVYLVGGTDIVREGLGHILQAAGFSIACSASGANDVIAAADRLAVPRLIVIDSAVAEDGLATCGKFHQQFPAARLVLLANDCTIDVVARAFELGLDGYLMKSIASTALVNALNLILAGEKFMPSAAYQALSEYRQMNSAPSFDATCAAVPLSDREIEILQQLARGDPNKRIARTLDIAEATVKVHIKAILRKLQVLNRTQAAIWAISRGLGGTEADFAQRATHH